MLRRVWRPARVLLATCLLAACGGFGPPGRIYTDIVEPLDTDMRRSRVVLDADVHARGTIQHIEYDGVSIEWSSTAIGDIARRHGIECVHHADIETWSILGVWTRRTLHIWGTSASSTR